MNTKNTGKGRSGKQADSAPKDIRTRTQITPADMPSGPAVTKQGVVSDPAVEQEVAKINPDVNSMESRG